MPSRGQAAKRLARRKFHAGQGRTARGGAAPAPTPQAAGKNAARTSPRVAAGAPPASSAPTPPPAAATASAVAAGGPPASGRRQTFDTLSGRQRRKIGRSMRGLGQGLAPTFGGTRKAPSWVRQHPGATMGAGALGLSAMGLYRNTGPGVTGNGYTGTGNSSGGRGF